MNITKNSIQVNDDDIVNTEWFQEVLDRAKEHGEKKRVEFWNPHGAAKALWGLAQGKSHNKIAQESGLDRKTVRELEWRHTDTLDTKRKEFSRKYAIAAEEYTDLLFQKAEQLADDPEQLKNISPDRLALTVGIMTDKATQLAGMAGIVIEHRKGASIEDAAKIISEAKARIANKVKAQAIDAEIIA
jgi:hypothetical protein